MASPSFIHLRVHTEHSLLEGAVPVKKLAKYAAEDGMPAVAITDSNVCFAALEFSDYAAKAGVQPIIGCQIDVGYLPPEPGQPFQEPAALVLLAQNEAGWMNLMKLNSCVHLGQANALKMPQASLEILERHSDGLICLTGGPDGPVGRLLRANRFPAAEALLQRLARAFPNRLYVELQRHPGDEGLPEAERLSEALSIDLAYALDLPLVATNDVHSPIRTSSRRTTPTSPSPRAPTWTRRSRAAGSRPSTTSRARPR